jgi:hypothetical protein
VLERYRQPVCLRGNVYPGQLKVFTLDAHGTSSTSVVGLAERDDHALVVEVSTLKKSQETTSSCDVVWLHYNRVKEAFKFTQHPNFFHGLKRSNVPIQKQDRLLRS